MTELNEEIKRTLSVEDYQQAVLFQFMTLYERWSEDRQVAAKQGYDLAKALQQFSKEVERFSSIEEAVIVRLRKSLNEATLALSEKVNTATAEALNTTLGASVECMEKASRTVETILAANQQIRSFWQLKTFAFNVLCSLLVSGLVLWFFMPQPTLPLSEEDMNTYVIGKRFARIWPTLSKEKQQWFLSSTKDEHHKKSP